MSRCEKDENGYHDPIQLHNYSDAVVEGCKLCNKKLIYIKHDGRINEAEYYNDHIRDFAQPYGSTRKIFERIYGKAGRLAVRRTQTLYGNVKSRGKIAAEWDETLKDSQRDMKRMSDDGYIHYR